MALLDRLRRRRDQPVPRVRVDRGHDRRGPARPRRDGSGTRRSSNYIKASGKGVLKVMSKMGVSTVASATRARRSSRRSASAQELVDEYFTGTVSRLGGIGLDEIAAEVAARHARRPPDATRGAGPPQARARRRVPVAARGRGPPVQPGDGVQAAARHAGQALRHLQAVHAAWSTTSRRGWPRCAGCSSSSTATAPAGADRRGRAGRATIVQAVLHRARCATARSRPRRTRRWPSR